MRGYGDPRLNWARLELAGDVLRRVTGVLSEAGIRVLPVKGIATSKMLYEQSYERPIRDIDIRLERKNLRRAIELARSNGWSVRTDSPRLFEAVLQVDTYEVDIECTLGPPGLCAISVEQAMNRARLVADPYPHLEADLHDHALILTLNVFKDGLRGMPWAFEDLRRIAEHRNFDPELLVARATDGGVLTVVWLVAQHMASRNAGGRWKAIQDRIGREPPAASVARRYRWLVRCGSPPRRGHIVTATSSDLMRRRVRGLALALGGVLRRRFVLALRPDEPS